MTTKKNESQFGNDAVDAMFSQKEDQTPESKQTAKQGDATRSNTSAKLNNQSTKRTNSTTETRSQRKQFLFTKETSVNMKVLAMSKKISVNEMVNEVMEDYIKKQFKKNPEVKSLASKLSELEGN